METDWRDQFFASFGLGDGAHKAVQHFTNFDVVGFASRVDGGCAKIVKRIPIPPEQFGCTD